MTLLERARKWVASYAGSCDMTALAIAYQNGAIFGFREGQGLMKKTVAGYVSDQATKAKIDNIPIRKAWEHHQWEAS